MCSSAEQARFEMVQGPQLDLRCGPDGKFTAEAPDYQGRWVKECRQGHHRETCRHRGLLYPPRAIPPRLSLLLAGRRRSAHPVSAAELVHPHDAVQRRHAREQRADQLAARAHQARPVRQFSGNQRRLGPLPRALLGHAAADLGLRADRQDGSRRQLRRTAGQARRARHRSLGRGEESQAPNCPTT